MMIRYRVFLAKEIVTQLRGCKPAERHLITRFFDQLTDDPFRLGDYTALDNIGRDIQVAVIGRYAVYFWSDHAVNCGSCSLELLRRYSAKSNRS